VRQILYLAWCYLRFYRVRSTVLVAAVAVILFLPAALEIVVDRTSAQLMARAETTPLLLGARGSPLELSLNALYFDSEVPATTSYDQSLRVQKSGLALAIPLYTRFRSPQGPIVGTTLDYFAFRELRIGSGRQLVVLGECVLGAGVARAGGLGVGDHVVSSPETVFDLAGAYPLKMRVVGVLEPAGTPDDHAVFVDIKTAWVISGLAHGHQDLSRPEAATGVLERKGNVVVANASVVQYQEITPDNLDSFHFHGDPAGFPVAAVIAVPRDDKAGVLLRGRYLDADEPMQILRPAKVIAELLGTVFTVRRYVIIAVALVGVATLATMALVFTLSVQLRQREMLTMSRIGGSRRRIAGIVAAEIAWVLILGATAALLLTVATSYLAADAVRWLVTLS
jgi:putative ABC transport system permease protein